MKNLSVLKDASEIVHYDNLHFPIYVKEGRLSFFTHMKALCHWHDDIEFIKSQKGDMNYYINGEKYLIKEGDGILINSKQVHYGYSENDTDCKFLCILFKPQILCINDEIQSKYIAPIVKHSYLSAQYLYAKNEKDASLIKQFETLAIIFKNRELGYELDALSMLNQIWLTWYKLIEGKLDNNENTRDTDIVIQKNMVSFIYENYKSKLTLNDIAQSAGVCRSKCCQIFKKYLNRTPIDFLNTYRLEVSTNLLRDTSLSITEITLSCGFNNPSYYSEIFLKYKGCTPGNYRVMQQKTLEMMNVL